MGTVELHEQGLVRAKGRGPIPMYCNISASISRGMYTSPVTPLSSSTALTLASYTRTPSSIAVRTALLSACLMRCRRSPTPSTAPRMPSASAPAAVSCLTIPTSPPLAATCSAVHPAWLATSGSTAGQDSNSDTTSG